MDYNKDLPFTETMKSVKQYKQKSKFYWGGNNNNPYKKVNKIITNSVGKSLPHVFNTVKKYINNESSPMSYVLKNWFAEKDDLYLENNIIKSKYDKYNIYTNKYKNYSAAFCKVNKQESDVYFITKESIVAYTLELIKEGEFIKVKNKERKGEYGYGSRMPYKQFVNLFFINRNPNKNYFSLAEITQKDADYFFNAPKYPVIECREFWIDITKCVHYHSLTEYKRLNKSKNYELINKKKKEKREKVLQSKLKSVSLLSEAMIDYTRRSSDSNQKMLELFKKNSKLSDEIRDRHGFDENSFIGYQSPGRKL